MSDLDSLRLLVRGAVGAMESSRQRIDDLNVYPVPDGDTGTNLLLTTRAIVEAIESSTAADRSQLAKEVARAGPSLGQRRCVSRGSVAGRGHDADGDPRVRRGGRGASRHERRR